jgi:hypothetical protein
MGGLGARTPRPGRSEVCHTTLEKLLKPLRHDWKLGTQTRLRAWCVGRGFDDQTAIKVVDDIVEVVSEGHRKPDSQLRALVAYIKTLKTG